MICYNCLVENAEEQPAVTTFEGTALCSKCAHKSSTAKAGIRAAMDAQQERVHQALSNFRGGGRPQVG